MLGNAEREQFDKIWHEHGDYVKTDQNGASLFFSYLNQPFSLELRKTEDGLKTLVKRAADVVTLDANSTDFARKASECLADIESKFLKPER